jgi:outer membrane protein assembly factor BamB
VEANNPPVLDWTGETDYTSDGLDPETGDINTIFKYRIKYSDVDDDPPYTDYPKVHIKKGGLDLSGSPFTMSFDIWADSLNPDYIHGAIYEYTTTLLLGNDYTYYFIAKDDQGLDATPTSELDAPDVNIHPELDWTGEPGYVYDGLDPETGDGFFTLFTYRIKYIDSFNDPPDIENPKVHIKKGGSDISGSPFTMIFDSWADPSNPDYIHGAIYSYSTKFTEFGNDYTYYFIATDDQGLDAIPTPELDAPDVSQYTSEPWWMFHHDEQHSGYSTSMAPNTENKIWEYETSRGIFSNPAVVDGVTYISNWDDNIYAINEYTGAIIWTYKTGGLMSSSPAVTGGKVYIGGTDSKLYCLDTAGNFLWSYDTGSIYGIYSSPVVVGGKVFFGSNDDKLYCLDTSGNFQWSYTTGGDILSSPAVAGGKVFFGSRDNKLYCLDTSGNFQWSYTTGGIIDSSPAVVGGKVFFGSNDDKLYCLDTSGNFQWSYTTGDGIKSSPAVVGGKVFFGSIDYKLYCLDINGNFQWSYTTSGMVMSSPAVADGKVYFGSWDGNLYCLDTNGNFKWSVYIKSYSTGPAIADGIVFACGGSWIYAFA